MQTPPEDDFYNPPITLPDRNGAVIRSRELQPPAALEAAARSELVLYRSEAVGDDRPIAVSGIVALPRDPAPGYPIVSWTHGTLGLGNKCAPSRDYIAHAEPLMQLHHRINQAPHVMLNAFLARGWAVAMTDYEGMGTPGDHPYLLGESEARSALHIVLAAQELDERVSGTVAVVGQSQGGQAALFAAHRAPQLTPGLQVRGVGALAPASHVKDQALLGSMWPLRDPGLAFAALFLTGAIAGAAAAGDPIDPSMVLTKEAFDRFQAGGDLCRVELSEAYSFGGLPGTEIYQGSLWLDPNEHQRKYLDQLDRMNPGLVIGAPIRVVQAADDTRVTPADTTRLVAELRALGDNVTYHVYPRGEIEGGIGPHMDTIATDTTAMTDWLAARFKAR